MDQPHDILFTLDQLKSILLSQNIPDQVSPTTDNAKQTVLPPSTTPLPPQALILPTGPPSAATETPPLTHVSNLLEEHILPYLNACSLSPNYYGFVTGGATPAALLADWLSSVYDQNVQVHLPTDTIATNVEVAALNLLVQLFNLPQKEWAVGTKGSGGGTMTTGATASNVLGLAIGREWVVQEAGRRKQASQSASLTDSDDEQFSIGRHGLLQACLEAGVSRIEVLSTMAHSSIAKAASIVGIGRENVISIGMSNDDLAIDIDKLERLASTMHEEGKAYILCVSAGEVNTGRFATDGLEAMKKVRSICDKYGIWIHVDAAFGLFGRVLMDSHNTTNRVTTNTNEDYTALIRGIEGVELADSITGDGHKLLNVPYDCGLFFTRHKHLSEQVFQNGNAAYLTSGVAERGNADELQIQSPLNIGIENSRRFRALPVWATLMAYGKAGYVDMLRRQIGLAREVVRWMWDVPGLEVLPRCEDREEAVRRTFMVVLFRARGRDVNAALVKRINATGKIYVTGTKWDGLPAARIAISNWQVDVERDAALIRDVVSGCLK